MTALSTRWFPLKPFRPLADLIHHPAKYNVIHAGRRAYKTESRKRRMMRLAVDSPKDKRFTGRPFRGLIAAPTHQQVADIYWADMKALIPPVVRPASIVSEVKRRITLPWGAIIQLAGMDKPERAEGDEWDYVILDEYANMKADVLYAHIMPMLTARMGFLDLVGVPEGRNHYHQCYLRGIDPSEPLWRSWGWSSSMVQSPEWIAEMLETLDDLTAAQELDGDFVAWQGRAYYCYDPALHLREGKYDPAETLIFCFDFNVEPGVACVLQETADGTQAIGEVWIPRHSNTDRICEKLIEDWGQHNGAVECYGDATGGARGTAKVQGSDWDIIRARLRQAFRNITFRVPAHNPVVRRRVNAVNSRLKSARGETKLYIDPKTAPHLARDLDGVALLEGSAGELDQHTDKSLTHISDALGYYIAYKYPIERATIRAEGGVYIGGGQGDLQ